MAAVAHAGTLWSCMATSTPKASSWLQTCSASRPVIWIWSPPLVAFPQQSANGLVGVHGQVTCDETSIHNRHGPADSGPRNTVALFEECATLAERAPVHQTSKVPRG